MPRREHPQSTWDEAVVRDARRLVALALEEDLAGGRDWTSLCLADPSLLGSASLVVREPGRVAGLPIVPLVVEALASGALGGRLTFTPLAEEGQPVAPGDAIGHLAGMAIDLLAAERTVLNFLGRMCGIATLTARFVAETDGTAAHIYDTRKTTPGWRRLEKYAVRVGGGRNHRMSLSDAVLIKDNHLALRTGSDGEPLSPAQAVLRARAFFADPGRPAGAPADPILEIEVDTLDQLEGVLPLAPDIVLLDNMAPEELRTAVAMRDRAGVPTELEASGGVTLATVRAIAATGIDRISSGALTHHAVGLDVGLDWDE